MKITPGISTRLAVCTAGIYGSKLDRFRGMDNPEAIVL